MQINVLQEVIDQLEAVNIPYMLSGSVAMCIYAEPRFTRDFDIIIEINVESIDKIAEFWKDKYYFSLPSIKDDIRRGRMFNIIHLETMYKIDFIPRSNQIFEIHKFQRRQKMEFMGVSLYAITPEDLIISKLNWIQVLESDSQKRDIKNLLTIPNLDIPYIHDWIARLNLNIYDLTF